MTFSICLGLCILATARAYYQGFKQGHRVGFIHGYAEATQRIKAGLAAWGIRIVEADEKPAERVN